MFKRLGPLVIALAATAPATAQHEMTPPASPVAQQLQPADQALDGRPGHVHSSDLVDERGGAGVFQAGFQMMYAFAKPEAGRSFREAWKRDPDCAICYWGEAWAIGWY